MDDIQIARASFDAFKAQDAAAAEALLADSFTFTSPQDDHIDKATWMERCFPTADHFVGPSVFLELVSTPHGVMSYYEYEIEDGKRYRNVEVIRIENDLIVETQVFFGGQVG